MTDCGQMLQMSATGSGWEPASAGRPRRQGHRDKGRNMNGGVIFILVVLGIAVGGFLLQMIVDLFR